MAITKWDPFHDILDAQGELNRLLRRTFGNEPFCLTSKVDEEVSWMPAIDVFEDKENFVVKSELPGLKKEDIEVAIEDNTLEIKGEKKFSKEVNEEDYYRIERRYGSFHRSIAIPDHINKEKIKANYENGLLTVTLPKLAEVKPKKIKVSIESGK